MMNTEQIMALREAGLDTEGALKRFSGNSALYQKFLLKFPQDDTFQKIELAFTQNDWEAVLASAHTLKGVAGNLGLTPLFDACANTVSLLRSQDYAAAAQSYGKLQTIYQEIIEMIQSNLAEEG